MPRPPNATKKPIRVYFCYEPDLRVCAERIDGCLRTNADLDEYDRRFGVDCDSPSAEPYKQSIQRWIDEADVILCLITSTSHTEPWIGWELGVSREASPRKGLVGVLLKDYFEPPAELKGCGAMFVPFRKVSIEEAVQWANDEKQPLMEDYTLEEE